MIMIQYINEQPIAILMATYNGGKYLRTQIESIIGQTRGDWHLYIRDDGSTDNTMELIGEYAAAHSNITVVEDSLGSLGVRDQFLHLLDVVDSDYYMFCDQDDVWFDDKIEKTMALMLQTEARHPDKGVLIGSDCAMCGPELEVVNKSCWDHLRINPKEFLTENGIFCYPFVTGASMVLNRRMKQLLLPLPEGLPKNRPMYDWWVLINAKRNGVVELLEEPTRYYRQHSNNVSGGVDKLDTAYSSKLKHLKRVIEANKTRASVLKKLGYSLAKYYFYKMVYLAKMMNYKHK